MQLLGRRKGGRPDRTARPRRGRYGRRNPQDGAHGFREAQAAYFDEVVQGRAPADLPAVPAPLPIGDFQAVVCFRAIFLAGDVDKLIGVEALEVGEQVHFPGLGYLLGGDEGQTITSSANEIAARSAGRHRDYFGGGDYTVFLQYRIARIISIFQKR